MLNKAGKNRDSTGKLFSGHPGWLQNFKILAALISFLTEKKIRMNDA